MRDRTFKVTKPDGTVHGAKLTQIEVKKSENGLFSVTVELMVGQGGYRIYRSADQVRPDEVGPAIAHLCGEIHDPGSDDLAPMPDASRFLPF